MFNHYQNQQMTESRVMDLERQFSEQSTTQQSMTKKSTSFSSMKSAIKLKLASLV
jgi:hypothetical protein